MTDKKRKTYSDTGVNLGPVRCEWLRKHGGKQPTIRRLIDAAMAEERLQSHCWLDERAAQALSESPGPQAQAGEVEEW